MIDSLLLPIMVPIARRGTQNGAEHKSGKWGRSDGRMDGWVGGQTKVEKEGERGEGNTPQISATVCTLECLAASTAAAATVSGFVGI